MLQRPGCFVLFCGENYRAPSYVVLSPALFRLRQIFRYKEFDHILHGLSLIHI